MTTHKFLRFYEDKIILIIATELPQCCEPPPTLLKICVFYFSVASDGATVGCYELETSGLRETYSGTRDGMWEQGQTNQGPRDSTR